MSRGDNYPDTGGEGETPFFAAVLDRDYEECTVDEVAFMWSDMYTVEQWRSVITTPLASGSRSGQTPFFAAVIRGQVPMLSFLRGAGRYTAEEWRTLITTPLVSGSRRGQTPLFAAVIKGQVQMLSFLRETGGYTPTAWQALMDTLRTQHSSPTTPSPSVTDSKANATTQREVVRDDETEETQSSGPARPR